ncbi:MAG: CRISPR-associated helicase/endonuclease Cas3, partial [Synergistaceae bacterium]|nr:CRISPR-associated helicase/endonuclease Cas3 [Synergistaceae bacterium]
MDKLMHYWGKTGTINEGDKIFEWHPVIYHCLDCAAVAMAWIDNSPAIKRSLMGREENIEILDWPLFFIYVHDYGKLTTPFQTMNIPLWRHLFPNTVEDIQQKSSMPYQHGTEGTKLFYKDNGANFEDYEECKWMDEAGDHHHRCYVGDVRTQCFAKKDSLLFEDELIARKEFLEIGIELFFKKRRVNFFSAPPVPNVFKGFCSVCDWIASDPEFFPFETHKIEPSKYLKSRMSFALSALTKCGLVHEKPKTFGMKGVFPEYTARGVQSINILPEKNGLYIIEAPTGSGKTETAVSIASTLVEQGYADSILFALPTQATANSMFERLENVAEKMYPEGSNIVLAHGKSKFNDGFKSLCARAAEGNGDEGLLQCSEWLATSKKRAFLGQIGVCTIDQVLMGALPVRHNFVRTFATGRSVLIVDEVHAYDSYMNGLLDKVLMEQRKCNGNAILLSATLPVSRKMEIIKGWSEESDNELSLEYPLITNISPDHPLKEFIPDETPENKVVHIEMKITKDILPDDELLQRAIKYAERGFTVAVICNIVSDAQEVWHRFKSITEDVSVDLFHSRYTFSDRNSIENDVITKYGKGRQEGCGSILVATQVIEQSLDLDFDFMITQVCPVELLFQRLGRLFRHERKTRPAAMPECVML